MRAFFEFALIHLKAYGKNKTRVLIPTLSPFQIRIDFRVKYPEHENNFIDAWPLLQANILEYVLDKIQTDPSFASSITDAGILLNFEGNVSVSYFLLCLMKN